MFLNFTNHGKQSWCADQISAAAEYGEIVDLPFPETDPYGDERYIDTLSSEYVQRVIEMKPAAVLCQGEMTLAFAVARKLIDVGVTSLAACSKRETVELAGEGGETVKQAVFRFVRFRKYS